MIATSLVNNVWFSFDDTIRSIVKENDPKVCAAIRFMFAEQFDNRAIALANEAGVKFQPRFNVKPSPKKPMKIRKDSRHDK
jgi:hypothetical protein